MNRTKNQRKTNIDQLLETIPEKTQQLLVGGAAFSTLENSNTTTEHEIGHAIGIHHLNRA